MQYKTFLLPLLVLFVLNSYGQIKKIDTILKVGTAGYRVICGNKKAGNNLATVKPVGFESTAREMEFYVKGRIEKTEIDDFNNDGFPDLVIYVFNGVNDEYGTVYAIASSENKSYVPIFFPDIVDEPKLRDGYKGHDVFSLLEGTLMRSFPVYKTGDAPDKPTGGKRVIQYKMFPAENGGYKFKVFHAYELKN